MSKIADDVYDVLKKEFPFTCIEKEYYVNYKNTKLFFDFYIKSLGLLFECQGRQHTQFVKHFHGDITDFYAQRRRDSLKVEYCEENDLTLVLLFDTIDVITNELVLTRIYEAMHV